MRWLCIVFVAFLAVSMNSFAQEAVSAPRIEAKQKTIEVAQTNAKSVAPTLPVPSIRKASDAAARKLVDGVENDGRKETEFWQPFFGIKLKITDTLLVAFTALLFCATALLYRATKKLVEGAEDTAKRQLRAYVLPEKAWLTNLGDLRPTFHFQAKNYGQTPAHEVTVWVGWRYFDIGDVQIPIQRPEIPNLSKYLLGPQGFTFHTDQVYLEDERKRKIREGKAIFFILGDIQYKDIFGTDRITKFRFAWGAGYDIGPDGFLMVHAEGNETEKG